MDLLSLPCDLKRIIFSKVDCVSLINAKLTSREFYLFIERNIKHMQKPKLYEIYVFENSNSYGINQYHVRFGFYPFNKEKMTSSIKHISMVYSDLNEFEYYLKRFNLKKIKNIELLSIKNTDILRIFGNYCHSKINLKSLKIDASDCKKLLVNISDLLYKVNYIKELKLNIEQSSDNKFQEIDLPKYNTLVLLHIGEKNETKFITKEMVTNFIINNPDLKYLYFDTKQYGIHSEIIQTIIETHFLKQCYFHYSFKIYFPYTENVHVYNDIKRILNNSMYEFDIFTESIFNKIYFEAFLPCSYCGKSNFLNIYYE